MDNEMEKYIKGNVKKVLEFIKKECDKEDGVFLYFAFEKHPKLTEKEQQWQDEQHWVNEQLKLYEGETIVYFKKEGKPILLAHSFEEKDLYKQFNKKCKEGIFDREKDRVIFRGANF